MTMNLLKTQSERIVLQIPCRDIYKADVEETVLRHLRNIYGDACGKNGFVLANSIQLNERSLGKLVSVDSKSCIEYEVSYTCSTIYPSPDDIFDCIVESNTKMGLIAYLDHNVTEEEPCLQNSPILFIVPVDFGGVDKQAGDKIKVSVMDSRIKFQSKQIQSVAKMA